MQAARLGKRMIPAALRPAIGRVWRRLQSASATAAERFAASSGFGAGLYYGMMSDAFLREHRAVAAGRSAYRSAQRSAGRSSFLLRRNIHRLEKALIITNRRPVFALDFIGETVREFEAVAGAHGRGEAPGPEMVWARDVLGTYFAATPADHPQLAPLRPRFEAAALRLDFTPADRPSVPFRRDLSVQPVAIEALDLLARRRRSVRHYLDRPVPRDLVDRAIAIAAQSPSACNRQPFAFLIFDDPATARRVAAVPAGTRTFMHGIQSIVVLVGRLRAYPRERDRHAIYVDASLAAMAFILGLESQGVASCAINWADEEPAESRIAAMLGLDPDERVILMISYGWPDPDALVPYSAKRPHDEFRIYNPPCRT
jgi:nitroreductase